MTQSYSNKKLLFLNLLSLNLLFLNLLFLNLLFLNLLFLNLVVFNLSLGTTKSSSQKYILFIPKLRVAHNIKFYLWKSWNQYAMTHCQDIYAQFYKNLHLIRLLKFQLILFPPLSRPLQKDI